jgi:hypothetical protein
MIRLCTLRALALPAVVSALLLLAAAVPCRGFEIESRFATIEYKSLDALQEFNHELYMGRLRSRVQKADTLEQEVANKLDYIVEKTMGVLDMHPSQLKFRVVIHPSRKGVQQDFKRLYGMDVNYIAFYAPAKNIVFYSARKANLRVVTHEIGHVVAEHYFKVSPPPKIHEVMAQYAEKHITD